MLRIGIIQLKPGVKCKNLSILNFDKIFNKFINSLSNKNIDVLVAPEGWNSIFNYKKFKQYSEDFQDTESQTIK